MLDSTSTESGLLSVCMIAKNEDAIIARVIKSITSVADEIIVVDTGSTDKTIEIAESLGAKVIRSGWKNDFAYSRNISIKDATCRWILWLDADDFVPENSLSLIEKIIKKDADRVYATVVKNRRPDGTGTSFMQARLFPNFKGIYFERPIHEQMMISALKLGYTLENTEIIIEHLGYVEPDIMKIKAARNCELLLVEYEKNINDPFMVIEIADSYTIMEEDENAKIWYEKLLKLDNVERDYPDLLGQALLGLGNILNRLEMYEKAEEILRYSIKHSIKRPDIYYTLAVSLDLSGQKEEAVNFLFDVLDMSEKNLKVGVDYILSKIKSYGRLFTLLAELDRRDALLKLCDNAKIDFGDRADIQNYIGRAFFYCGKLVDSLRAFEASITIQKQGNIAAFIGLILIYIKAGKMDVAKSTAKNILPEFGNLAAFHAVCNMYNLLTSTELSDYSINLDDLEVEKKRILDYYPM